MIRFVSVRHGHSSNGASQALLPLPRPRSRARMPRETINFGDANAADGINSLPRRVSANQASADPEHRSTYVWKWPVAAVRVA
jgi:hypothetical protein